MTHIPNEIQSLKISIFEMWSLVISQMVKARYALEHFDKDLVSEITSNEKRVDAFELKLNLDCENILALYSPVANDLRFVLSVLKTNYNLERVGDYAYNIATLVRDLEHPIDQECIVEMLIRNTINPESVSHILKNRFRKRIRFLKYHAYLFPETVDIYIFGINILSVNINFPCKTCAVNQIIHPVKHPQ